MRLFVHFVIGWLIGVVCGFYIARAIYFRPQKNTMSMPLVAAMLDDRKGIDE